MQWSQLRKRLLGRMADCIRGRVDLHQTRYRSAHDQEGEIWLTIDRERVFSSGSATYLSRVSTVVGSLYREGMALSEAYERAWPIMESSGLLLLEVINKVLADSLNLSLEDMLAHRNPLVRGLAVLDARLGKRRMRTLNTADEQDLVKRLHHLRCEAEAVRIPGLSLPAHGPAAQ